MLHAVLLPACGTSAAAFVCPSPGLLPHAGCTPAHTLLPQKPLLPGDARQPCARSLVWARWALRSPTRQPCKLP